ncbi:MAG TPA: lasso peptide biosynthesis B2 protein [Pyrinomonadaceae bacterium]|nr:lasso peptide biosynthesis B2 protein [Pyrinomonadaceae bacterium]
MTPKINTQKLKTPRFYVSPDVYSARDQDGTVILNVNNGRLYSLINAGSSAWQQIADDSRGVTVDTVMEGLLAEGMFVQHSRAKTRLAVKRMLNRLVELGIAYSDDKEDRFFSNDIRSLIASVVIYPSRLTGTALIALKLYTGAAFLYLLMFDLVLKLAGFRYIHNTAKRWSVARNRFTDEAVITTVRKATDRACTWYPKRAMCLPRAVVMTCLLRELGIEAVTVIAIQKNPFVGHAWSEISGRITNDETVVRADYSILERV